MKKIFWLIAIFSILLSGCASSPKPDKEQDNQAKTPVPESSQAVPEQQEQQAWEVAQKDNSITGYNRYLHSYPSGRHFAEAGAKLKLLNEKSSNGTATPPVAANIPEGVQYKGTAMVPAMVPIPGKNYEIGKYEVTQVEWRSLMGNNPSKFGGCGDSCPVEKVSWDDAQAFIQKLNAQTGKQYRLPTEAEWEYACYGGTQSELCGGNDADAIAWIENNSKEQTHPVGQKRANGFGLYDMSGNVMEWTDDCWEGDCAQRAIRGGSWNSDSRSGSASYRIRFITSIRNSSGGFRLARTIP